MVGDAALWELERGTVQDTSSSALTSTINSRTKDRGTVASCLQSFAFSLTVNAHLDKFGKIDPSTSTVFVGMTLGGTFGFVLDNMLGEKLSRALPLCCPSHGGVTPPGSDEGFREYLWSPQRGMKYAIGALATARYGRYLLTIIFDMFFTVILFKLLYSKLVLIPPSPAGASRTLPSPLAARHLERPLRGAGLLPLSRCYPSHGGVTPPLSPLCVGAPRRLLDQRPRVDRQRDVLDVHLRRHVPGDVHPRQS